METRGKQHTKGLILTATGGLALTIDIPLIRLADGDTWSVLLLRSAVTFVAALLIWAVWRAAAGRQVPALLPGRIGILVAGLYGLASISFMFAVHNTSTANLVFILAFNSMFAALLSWLFLGERPRPVTLAAMGVMLVGVLIIVGDGIGTGNMLGDTAALVSTMLLAGAITLTRASGRDMGFTALVGVFVPFVVAGFVVGNGSYRIAEPWWIVFNGAVVMPIAFYCLAAGPKYVSAPEVAMFYLLETILAPIWVWMIFAEVPSPASLIGGGILILALLFHSFWQLGESRRRRAAATLRHPA